MKKTEFSDSAKKTINYRVQDAAINFLNSDKKSKNPEITVSIAPDNSKENKGKSTDTTKNYLTVPSAKLTAAGIRSQNPPMFYNESNGCWKK